MNIVMLIGRLVADPELRFTQSGKAVCNFRIAVDRRFDRDNTDFFKVTVWGKQAESTTKYLKKGSQAAIQGEIQIEQYTDKEGINRRDVNINANQVEFLSRPDKRLDGPGIGYEIKDEDAFQTVEDDDIPF